MIAGRLFCAGGKAIGKLCAVVRQDRAGTDRAGRLQALEEIQAALFALVVVDRREDPSAGTVGGDEEITPGGFIGHSGQLLDVDMDETRRVFLEALLAGRRILLLLLLGAQTARPFAL
jgi:hypothetical protein